MAALLRPIVIISKVPLYCEALKSIVKEVTPSRVFIYSDLARGINKAIQIAPALIFIEDQYVSPKEFEPLFEHTDRDTKVVVIDWDENKMAIYSRTAVSEATMENLSQVIKSIKWDDPQQARNAENARLHKANINE